MSDTRMTNEEILDRLQALFNKLLSGAPAGTDEAIEATGLFTELSDRLTAEPQTQVTLTTHISGTPEMIGMALGKFISENISPDEIAQFREQLLSRVIQSSTGGHDA